MKPTEIKVISGTREKQVFINGVKQDGVLKVENEVLPGEIDAVKITYVVNKYEVIEESESVD